MEVADRICPETAKDCFVIFPTVTAGDHSTEKQDVETDTLLSRQVLLRSLPGFPRNDPNLLSVSTQQTSTTMPSSLSSLINLSNSIIGVSLLTMPYCFQQCGILLSCVVLALSALVNKYACHLLLKAAMLTRRRKLEYLAYQTLGYNGKLLIEVGLICFLLGGCVALFVVAGDLLPALLSSGVAQESRVYLMVFLAFFVALPLSLRRNTESLTSFSLVAMMFYVFLAIKMFFDSLPALLHGNWFHRVVWWNTDNLLAILPIFAMALAGQPQVFEVFDLGAVDVPQMRVLDRTVSSAMHTCLTVYTVVGFCGYIGQYQRDAPLPGNSLLLLDDSWMSWMFKLGFVASLIMSFPLCLFPCRTSLHSVIYRRNAKLHEVSSSLHDFIPENRFKLLTLALLSSTLGAALLIPRIELFLGITGATIGCVVCLVAPARIFLGAANGKNQTNALEGFMAQFVVLLGLVIMALCSFSMINRLHQPEAFSPPTLNSNGNSANINDNTIHKILKDLPLGPKNSGIVAPVIKDQQQQQVKAATSRTIVEIKPPLAEKENKRIEPPEPQNEIHEIKAVSNKTIVAADAVKYHVANNDKEQPVVPVVDTADTSRVGESPGSNIVDVKPLNKPFNIGVNVDKGNAVNGNLQPSPLVAKAKEAKGQQPAATDTVKSAGGSDGSKTGALSNPNSARVGGKKDKDEIKLLEKIAEVQQEQKKMIEDIQKELKQEIALHKEIKANHSKENEFVELIEEKMKRIDKHIQEVDKIGNKTLKDVIETESANVDMRPNRERLDKMKPIEFKGPLKILNNRMATEQAMKNANAPVVNGETRQPIDDSERGANIHSQDIRRIELPLGNSREAKGSVGLSDKAAQEPQNENRGLPSYEKAVYLPKQIVTNKETPGEQPAPNVLRGEGRPDGAAPSMGARQAESAASLGDTKGQRLAESPNKPVVIPVEKPELLSEVTRDQGPALMKDLDKSIRQDKQPLMKDKKLLAGVQKNSDEPAKSEIDRDKPFDKKPEKRLMSKDSTAGSNAKVEEKPKMLERQKEENPPKVGAAPLVVKMNPAANNVTKKETIHKEI